MHEERLAALLQRLDGLRLPPERLFAGGDEGYGDFSDLEIGGRGVLEREFWGKNREEQGAERHTRREKGSFKSRRSVVR